MKFITLTQGKTALVDDEDYDGLASYKWRADQNRHTWYALRYDGPNQKVYMHRQILQAKPKEQTDHVNGDGLDNRRVNLRLGSTRQNQQNRKTIRGRSRFKGVSFIPRKRRWRANITVNGRQRTLGSFKTEQEAALVYNWAAACEFGEYAHLNDLTTE